MTRTRWVLAALTLAACGLVTAWVLVVRPTPAPHPSGPEAAFEAFVVAQEQGDVDSVATMVISGSRDRFREAAQALTRDELISAALTFREDGYQLEVARGDVATFYSPRSALYLIMRREEGQWRVDPDQTDRQNREQ